MSSVKRRPRLRLPEAVEMVLGILAGGGAGPGAGWFHPSQTLYGWSWLARRMDANRDDAVTREEFSGPPELFDRLDRDGDGRLTAADFDWPGMPPGEDKPLAPADQPSRWMLLKALFQGEIGSLREGPALGSTAPPFRLPTQDGTRMISLSDYRGQKPVVLIFGNFT
jgi:hypothetical protein